MAILVCTTDELPRTVFISDALVAVLVWATDEFSGAAFFFGAGELADARISVGTRGAAVECYVEEE